MATVREHCAADVAVRNYFNRSTLLPPKDVFEALQQLKKEADAARWQERRAIQPTRLYFRKFLKISENGFRWLLWITT
jgi:hypothetical protein